LKGTFETNPRKWCVVPRGYSPAQIKALRQRSRHFFMVERNL